MQDPFDTFEVTAFRYEALPNYPEQDGSNPDVSYFNTHGTLPGNYNHEWVELVTSARRRGADVLRLRAVGSPLSEYERFELLAGYKPGVAAGEDIRVLPASMAPSAPEFWFYDDHLIEILTYDEHGRFVTSDVHEAGKAELEFVKECLSAYRAATPVVDYVEQLAR